MQTHFGRKQKKKKKRNFCTKPEETQRKTGRVYFCALTEMGEGVTMSDHL